MMNLIIPFEEIKRTIDQKIQCDFWNKELGLVRTLIALATLLTLIFNSTETLFLTGTEEKLIFQADEINYMNIYSWFDSFLYGKIFSIIVLLLVVSGIYPRITCVFHWLVSYSFTITSICTDGGDQVASIITLLLIPICLLDHRKSHWIRDHTKFNYYKNNVATVFCFLMTLQVFVIYFFASTGKFGSEVWKNGTAFYYYSTMPQMGLSKGMLYELFSFIIKSPLVVTLSTWGVLVFELVLAIGVFLRNEALRKYIFTIGVLFHFMIVLFYGIFSFSLIMTACLFFVYKYNPLMKNQL